MIQCEFIVNKLIKEFINRKISFTESKILILGITFKENCPDIRNSKVVDLFLKLRDLGINLDINDPLADKDEVYKEYGIKTVDSYNLKDYKGIILAVPHNSYIQNKTFNELDESVIFFDLKSALNLPNSITL